MHCTGYVHELPLVPFVSFALVSVFTFKTMGEVASEIQLAQI